MWLTQTCAHPSNTGLEGKGRGGQGGKGREGSEGQGGNSGKGKFIFIPGNIQVKFSELRPLTTSKARVKHIRFSKGEKPTHR